MCEHIVSFRDSFGYKVAGKTGGMEKVKLMDSLRINFDGRECVILTLRAGAITRDFKIR